MVDSSAGRPPSDSGRNRWQTQPNWDVDFTPITSTNDSGGKVRASAAASNTDTDRGGKISPTTEGGGGKIVPSRPVEGGGKIVPSPPVEGGGKIIPKPPTEGGGKVIPFPIEGGGKITPEITAPTEAPGKITGGPDITSAITDLINLRPRLDAEQAIRNGDLTALTKALEHGFQNVGFDVKQFKTFAEQLAKDLKQEGFTIKAGDGVITVHREGSPYGVEFKMDAHLDFSTGTARAEARSQTYDWNTKKNVDVPASQALQAPIAPSIDQRLRKFMQ